MKKPLKVLLWALTGIMLALSAGCPDEGTTVDSCSKHKDKTACENAKDKNGKQCKYDEATKTCSAEEEQVACKKLDEAKCKASKDCTYDKNAVDEKCKDADAVIKGKCEAIQDETTCDKDTTCKWNKIKIPNVCETKATAAKNITEFKLTKIDKTAAGYDIADDDKIKDVIASGDGRNLYVIGTVNEVIRHSDLTTWTKIPFNVRKAEDFAKTFDFTGRNVIRAVPLEDGLFAWVTGKGAVQLHGTNSFAWDIGSGNIPNNDANGLGEVEKGGNRYLLMSVSTDIVYVQKRNVQYPDKNWSKDLVLDLNTGKASVPLKKRYKQLLPVNDGMFWLQDTGKTVDFIRTPNIAAGAKAGIIDTGNPANDGKIDIINENPAWRHSGAKNPAVKLAVMDKYYVAIFSGAAGGIAVCETSKDPALAASWHWVSKTTDATNIIVLQHNADATLKNKRALITAKNGFAILEGTALLELVPGQTFINDTNSTSAAVTTHQGAKSGSVAGSAALPAPAGAGATYVGAGEMSNGDVYIGIRGDGSNDGGVFLFKMDAKTINP